MKQIAQCRYEKMTICFTVPISRLAEEKHFLYKIQYIADFSFTVAVIVIQYTLLKKTQLI